MSPRRGGGRVSHPPRDRSASGYWPPTYADTPPPKHSTPVWSGPWRSRYVGLRTSGSSTPQKLLTVSENVIENVIPAFYGQGRQVGYCAFLKAVGHTITMGFVHAFGEQASNTDPEFSGEDISGASQPAWVISVSSHKGDGSALSAALTAHMGATEEALWKTLAHTVVKIDGLMGDIPYSFSCDALLGGQLVTDWNAATTATTNPIKVAYDMYTNSVVWKRDLSAVLDDGAGGTWQTFADWCDETVGTGPLATERWKVTGPIYMEDPEAAVLEVLGHCHAEVYCDPRDGLIKVWGEIPCTAISGTCSAAATSTITVAGGDPLNDLDEGDYVYFDGYYDAYGVSQVQSTAGGSFVIDQAVTLAAGTICRVLPYGGIYLRKDRGDMVRLPAPARVSPKQLAKTLNVKYTNKVEYGELKEAAVYGGGGNPTESVTLSLCHSASMAVRWGETRLNMEHMMRHRWRSITDISGKAARLDVGDVFLFDDQTGARRVGRIRPPRTDILVNGSTVLEDVVEFHGDIWSGSTKATPTITGNDTNWTTADPEDPTNVALIWRHNRDRKTTNSQAANNWSTNGTAPTVTTNTENSPDGTATADTITPSAAGDGYIQLRDAIVEDFIGSTFYQAIWLRSATEQDLDLGSEYGASGYGKVVRVRTHWRLFRQLSLRSGAPYQGPAIQCVKSAPAVIQGNAHSWPTEADGDHVEWFQMTWTPASDSNTLNRYELQYKLYNYQTSTEGEWVTHGIVGPLATSISWGNSLQAQFPALPGDDQTGGAGSPWVLYDWRVVAYRGARLTELIPTTVTDTTATIGVQARFLEDKSGIAVNMVTANGIKWQGQDTGATPVNVGHINASDEVQLGENGYITRLMGDVVSDGAEVTMGAGIDALHGAGRVCMHAVEGKVTYADIQTAATTLAKLAFTLPAGAVVHQAYLAVKTAGVIADTLTLSVGVSGAYDQLIASCDGKSAAAVYGDAVAELGSDMTAQANTLSSKLYSLTAAQAVYLYADANATNLDQLSAGEWWVIVLYSEVRTP